MHRRHVVVVSPLLLAALLAGCSSSSDQARKGTSSAGSPTPSAARSASNTFTSRISLLPGLRFTWPTSGWRPVDSPGDLVIHPPSPPGAVLRVAKGLYPTDPSGGFVTSRVSATRVIAALRGMPALRASRPVRDRIGDGIKAVRVDIRLSPSAPRSGFAYLTYRAGQELVEPFTIKPGMVVRVYAAVYRAPYGHDLLNIVVEAPTATAFADWTGLAARALRTIRLPKGLVASSTWEG